MAADQRRHNTIVLICLAVLLLCLIPVAVQHQRNSQRGDQSKSFGTRISEQYDVNSRARRELRSQKKTIPTHKSTTLKHFHLPSSTLENVTLSEAVAHLLNQYHEVCYDTGETPCPLKLKINGKPKEIRFIRFDDDFLSNLRLLGAFSNTTFSLEENTITFAEIPNGPIITKRFSAPPDLRSAIHQLLAQENPRPSDPFKKSDQPTPVSELLKQLGLIEEGEVVSYLAGTGTLITRASSSNTTRTEQLLDYFSDRTHVQIVASFPSAEIDTGGPFPVIIMQPGQPASIDFSREFIYPTDDSGNSFSTTKLGTNIIVTSELYGFGERSTITFTHRELSDEKPYIIQAGSNGTLVPQFEENIFVTDITSNTRVLEQSPTAPSESTPATEVTPENLHISTQRIDATGRPININEDTPSNNPTSPTQPNVYDLPLPQ